MATCNTLRERVQQVAHLPCVAHGCTRRRQSSVLYCAAHAEAKRLYGHREGRRIPKQWYADERKQLHTIITENPTHPAIHEGTTIIRETLAEAASNPKKSPAHYELCRVALAGVKPETILAEVGALFVYAQRRPHILPDDERLTYAMGYAVSLLAPRPAIRTRRYSTGSVRRFYKSVPGASRREVGRWLRNDLAPLLFGLNDAANSYVPRDGRRRRAMQTPIHNNSSTTQEQHQQ